MKASSDDRRYPRLHRDGTVSYWSWRRQEWVQHAFHVPEEDMEQMASYDRQRVCRHLGYEAGAVAS
jgi:hypothetical protein